MFFSMNLLRSGIKTVVNYSIAVFYSKPQQAPFREHEIIAGHNLVSTLFPSTFNSELMLGIIPTNFTKYGTWLKFARPVLRQLTTV
jgi:hypothetical protein